MKYFETDFIKYLNNQLVIENVTLEKIAKEFGTPVYVYSKNHFVKQFEKFSNAFKNVKHKIFYAMKANYNLSVIKTFVSLGSGVDVNSEGELYRALKAGINPNKIVLTGVGKTNDEIRLGIEKDLLMIKAESEAEVEKINKIASQLNKIAKVAIRVNPNVNPKTHQYITTGLATSKFGVDEITALNIYKNRDKYKNIRFTGIDMHIGSQITSLEPFELSVRKLFDIYKKVKNDGLKLQHFDIGGGFGVNYLDNEFFTIEQFATVLYPYFQKLDCEIFFEPGRFLTANGGVLVTEVLYTNSKAGKSFIIVDAAINDLLRPALYQAYHHIQPLIRDENRKTIIADIVGPVCETGDYFAKDREILQPISSELLAIMSVGAYGMVMSSNYNGRRRPAEVLVDNENVKIIRNRESFDSIMYDEESLLN